MGASTVCNGHHVSFHTCSRVCQSDFSAVEDGLECVECGDGHWPDSDHAVCDRMKDIVPVDRNGLHHRDTGVLVVVATDLVNAPVGPGHGTYPGADNSSP